MGFPGGSDGLKNLPEKKKKESACNAGELSSIPVSEGSSIEGNGNALQYSCLENFMDSGASWAIVHAVAELYRTEQVTLQSVT